MRPDIAPGGTVPADLLENIKKHLAAGVPSMFGFTVYDSISQAQGTGRGRIPFPNATDRVAGGHAVAAVGYDDTIEIKHSGSPSFCRTETAGSSRRRIMRWSNSSSIQRLTTRLISVKSSTMPRSSSVADSSTMTARPLWPCKCLHFPS